MRPRMASGHEARPATEERSLQRTDRRVPERAGNHRLMVGVSAIMSDLRWRIVILAVGLLAVTAAVGGFFMWRGTATGSGAQVVDAAAAPIGWKTIEFEGVRVDIPSEWERSDRSDCEFEFERWAQQDEVGCDTTGDGVSFYVSATFDPHDRPGLKRRDASTDAKGWAGYTYVGDYAVYVSGENRGVLAEVLRSVRST
jgi:hypothetical protein